LDYLRANGVVDNLSDAQTRQTKSRRLAQVHLVFLLLKILGKMFERYVFRDIPILRTRPTEFWLFFSFSLSSLWKDSIIQQMVFSTFFHGFP
jgi:hypothetical protein